ncbi:MAG TPA: hypothetical protein VF840_08625 [Terriglobales bacterium]
MRKILFALAVLALVVSATVTVPTVAAQSHTDSASSGPPPVIQMFREEVKPGKGPLHAKTEAAWVAAYRKANLKYYYLGTTAMTGPSEAWFLSAYASMEDAEKAQMALEANKAVQAEIDRVGVADGDLLSGVRSTYLFYNPELSYRPNFNLGEYKYFMVDTYRIKLGHGEKFAELRKAVNAGHEKANMDEHMLVYGVGLGAPTGTIMVFQPVKSLKEFDDFAKTHGKGSAYYEVVGDAGRKMFADFAREDEQFFVRDFLAFSPGMSFLSEKVIASNPSFWKPKTEMAKAPAAKKEPAKIEKK